MSLAAKSPFLISAHRTFDIEIAALQALRSDLGAAFHEAVSCILNCQGRIVVTGIGKSGHIGRKIAATFASTGTPALFMHAAEALHGDLGMITPDDLIIAISYSGTATELMTIVNVAQRLETPVIAITGHPQSELAKLAHLHLNVHVSKEACPLNLAPTASTTATIVLGDALAVACLQAKGFTEEDFARSHPGGASGRRLLTYVRDVMRQGKNLPIVPNGTLIPDALTEMSNKGMGMTIIVNKEKHPVGIFTDCDLRRLIAKEDDIRQLPVDAGMTKHPKHINANALAVKAATMMDELRISQLLVLAPDGTVQGALHMHDLLAAKVI